MSRSVGVGLLAGGAHLTGAVTYVPVSRSPSSIETDVGWLARPGPVQRGVEPVAAAVAGEHPSRAVRAVRGRGEPHDEDPRVRVAEAGYRTAPVGLVGERGALDLRDLLAPGDQPGTAPALADLPGETRQRGTVGHGH